MPVKNLDDLAVGDVLSGDVANSQGVVLVRAGIEISEAHLRLFRALGVKAAAVADPDDAGAVGEVAVGEECLARAEATIKKCFGESLDDDVMAEISRVAVEMRAAKLAVGEIDDSD